MATSMQQYAYRTVNRCTSRHIKLSTWCLQAMADRAAVSTARDEPAVAAEQPGTSSTGQCRDSPFDQAAFVQRLRQEAFEAGYKAGYQNGVQVQVSVSVDLDDDNGSHLRRRQMSRTGSNGGSNDITETSSSSSSSSRQPWLPPSREKQGVTELSTAPAAATAAAGGSVQRGKVNQAGDSIVRSAVKGLVWRIFSTTATVTVALVLFQDSLEVSDALKFAGIEFATKYVLYFLHERLWAAIALL